jgi:isovaleryl-CoA dehydrogenase
MSFALSTDFDLFNPSAEHRAVRQTVKDFTKKEVEPQAVEFNRFERFNLPLFRRVGELGLLGITVPEVDGGAGMDAVAAVIVHEELAVSDPGFAVACLAHGMLFVNNFYCNANAEQRARILPKVLSGEWVGGLCMSEPGVGTDVLGMSSTAERSGNVYRLQGRKLWITNGAIDRDTSGDVFLVYAKTNGRISSFVVEKNMPGFTLGQKIEGKLGVRSSTFAELVFDNCEVPVENRLGEEGESLIHMMRNLELERLTLAAISLGIAMRCLRIMVGHANERVAFGRPIKEFGQIQRYIGRSYATWRAARSYVYDVARQLTLDQAGHRVDSDGAKLMAATMAKDVADSAIQVLGAMGYVEDTLVERFWRDAKGFEIGGGTLEAHEKNITFDLARAMDTLLL